MPWIAAPLQRSPTVRLEQWGAVGCSGRGRVDSTLPRTLTQRNRHTIERPRQGLFEGRFGRQEVPADLLGR